MTDASPAAPPAAQEELARLVKAAQAHDHAARPRGRNWTRVPDDQVARLITGALRDLIAERDEFRRQRDELSRAILDAGKDPDA